MDLRRWLTTAVEEVERWQEEFGKYTAHPAAAVADQELGPAFAELAERLRDNYPFFHPRYAGQMIKPAHPAAVAGHLVAMLVNPNNHALDGGPATARMEREVVARLAGVLGYGPDHLGHLTTSGTIANLEALYVARETHPGRAVAHSADAHYTHSRMCRLLGVEAVPVPTDDAGRMDLDALESLLRTHDIGTVVLTAGTTGLGAVDPVHEALALRESHGVRLHVDAAYGGFFTLIADDSPDGVTSAPFRALGACDSLVVDPHKHGLQPYGCGAVLFADPAVERFYRHDSPYTYFTSAERHLGEVSLECSRAGAAAAALWLTFRLLPPTPEGLGRVLRPGRRAALRWADLLAESPVLAPYQRPELDIVTYLPRAGRLSEIDALSAAVLEAGMTAPAAESVFVATYGVDGPALTARGHEVEADVAAGRILRSVLMKPEHDDWLDYLHTRIEELVRAAAKR
ncbi:aspartate aminotransferase family protein [Saccharopolyspora erythraea]|uniref:pyridoxal phosphate-dependent decarboxylase family protein n=1 Tax=Saccharopolyspora erythraea TaxID=1836 RepID=UPI001BAC7126|nr:aminotransferase class I/II-fold pyridoxal phosphate-dependent enzyme [Saccharopolyspora erythraea]QUG99441.1 aspartate aminotransferase family protein [Saccharopolyspora erythraea]